MTTLPVREGDVILDTRRATVLGLPVDRPGLAETLDRLCAQVDAQQAARGMLALGATRSAQVVTLNPEMAMQARRHPGLRAIIREAALVVPDGMGIVWAARLLGQPVPERVTGVELLVGLAGRAARRGYRVFLLGAAPGVAEAAAERLRAVCPGLDVAGTYAGSPLRADDAATAARVRASGADIVFVAYGAPAQEYWIARNRDALGGALAMGVGGAFDFLAGRVPRAPVWMRQRGLEWLYRLWREPWRWRRMLALPRFAAAVVGERVWP